MIPAQAVFVTFVGDGTTTSFTFNKRVYSAAELALYTYTPGTDDVPQLVTTGVTTTVADDYSSATSVFTTAPAAGVKVGILRATNLTQDIDVSDTDYVPPSAIEKQLDRQAMMAQEAALHAALALPSDPFDFTAADRAQKVLAYDADGNPTVGPTVALIGTVATNVAAAAASATAAATSETNAAGSATASATSAAASLANKNAAGTSETNSAASATASATSAAASLASKNASATSETNAAASAATATTQATNSAASATASANSATASATAQTAAENARDQTLASFTDFDTRYLGAKASDPTLNNEGGALTAGELYFDTATGVIKVYTGTSWVAAYVSGAGFAVLALNGSDYTADTFRTNLSLYSKAESDAAYATAAQGALAASAVQANAANTFTALQSFATGIAFTGTLSTSNQIADFQQGYGLWSDDTGTHGTTRLWFDGPDAGEFIIGPRAGVAGFAWLRVRADLTTLEGTLTVNGNSIVYANADTALTGGYTATADNDGTITTGTYTPSPSGGNLKRIINGGAFTFAAPTAAGDYTLIVQVTNNASAGSVTTSGFTKWTGDGMDHTSGDSFFVFITKLNGFTSAVVQALQ